MKLHEALFFCGIATAIYAPSIAMASCPNSLDNTYCDGDPGSVRNPYCTFSSGSVTCYLDANLGTSATHLAITSPSSTSVQVWGEAADGGTAFCCEYASLNDGCAGTHINVQIHGTAQADHIRLNDLGTGGDLDCSDATVQGLGADDQIWGSRLDTNSDYLLGGDQKDTIYGEGGADHIYGEGDDDDLFGDDGDDWIFGGDERDQISGGAGEDHLYGGPAHDYVCGDDDWDTIDGGDHEDHLFDPDGADIYSGTGSYPATCGYAPLVNMFGCTTTTLTSCPTRP
jgi:Ca2+-binding RTX toxin-like protein